MDNFENIKVGDKAFVKEYVKTGWASGKQFQIEKPVIRTTKTQFVVEGGQRFKKDGGREIGHSYERATLSGVDESENVNILKKKINMISCIHSKVISLDGIVRGVDYSCDLDSFVEASESIDDAINKLSKITKKKSV